MNKILIDKEDFTFDASEKTISFTQSYGEVPLEHLLVITNITDNKIIYNFACKGFGGAMSGLVLTLDYDTTGMSDTDELQIIRYSETSAGEDTANQYLKEIKKSVACSEQLVAIMIEQTEILKQMF